MKPLLILALPPLLGSCALLGTVRDSLSPSAASPAVVAPGSPLTAQAGASVAPGAGAVAATLTLRNTGQQPVTLRYAAGMNWGNCGLPPFVALARAGGEPLPPPALPPGAACPELLLSRTLAPGETLTLRRTLPPLPPGTYTLSAWLDGQLGGQAARVTAPPIRVQVP
ncbi:hypothetical protein [Deinococcus budaensis]|uniref:Intracellular proteinase inhibitor BsuPI domain-containing protein n=1 Tax=Deinococcus budaensis TaxID=1665626 RepID=A0A7W8LNU8_9DEIO|nr:hypothetical protein [Deinococcus budaensis]MBB5233091.1 hypothetical protein [Deinococcus budaensis]